MARLFGEDFSGVRVRFGAVGLDARAAAEGDTVTFSRPDPSREEVAHELVHVVQVRRSGPVSEGMSGHGDASEREARDLATRAARGEAVQVRAAPSAAVHRDDEVDDVASRIHADLHGWIDDEAAAVAEIEGDRDVGGTCASYEGRYGVKLWTDFIGNASGPLLNRALTRLWPHMTVLDRLETRLGWDDDEEGIKQIIESASDAELLAARGGIQPYLDELEVTDQYTARTRIWPEDPVANVLWLLSAGNGWFWDDEGPVANAILSLTPADRARLWNDNPDAFGMFNDEDKAKIGRMCVARGDVPATEADALQARMELATDGWGTDEEGVQAAVGVAGSRRDELARIDAALQTGTTADGNELTPLQRTALERRKVELGDIDGLLTVTETEDGTLDTSTFLGRVQDEVDSGTTDASLATVRVDPFTRARQALLATVGVIDVDETAALAILAGIQGEVTLGEGETLDSLSADEARRRREASAADIRKRLRDDPALAPVWDALNEDETAYADALTTGNTLEAAIHQLTEAYEGIDSDETAILKVLRDMPAPDRQSLIDDPPQVVTDIRGWYEGDAFLEVFEAVLATGRIPTDAALGAAYGGDWDGTDEELADEALLSMSEEERARYRRGYLLEHTVSTPAPSRVCAVTTLSESDQAALDAYRALYARMRSEYTDEELDLALNRLIGVPSLDEIRSEQGRVDAATIMLERQRERLELGGGLTDVVSNTDDTAAAAHVEFASRYELAMAEGGISMEEFAVLVSLDQQFARRFDDWSSTVNLVSEIAGTVAAVVAAAVVIAASGGTATAATPGIVAWLSANSGLIATSAAVGALSQVTVSEAFGGSFNEMTDADGARQALMGSINGAVMIAGAALAEQAAGLVGLSGRALTAQIARSAAASSQTALGGQAFARGALMGLIDGSLGGAVGELAMTLTDAETWKRSVWDVLGRAGAALLRGGLLGGATGALTGGILETAQMLIRARALRNCAVEIDETLGSGAHVDFGVADDGTVTDVVLRFGPNVPDGDLAAHVDTVVSIQRAGKLLQRVRSALGEQTFPPNTAAGNAAEELPKLDRMIQDRLRQLRGTGLSPETRELVEAEMDVLEANVDEFTAILERGDLSPGSGRIGRPDAPPGYPDPPEGHYYRQRDGGWDLQRYPDSDVPPLTLESDGNGGWTIVGREGSAAPSARFPDGTTAEQAFDQLVGPDSKSSFKQYWEMLRDNDLATREEVIAAMLAPSGRTEDSVRHALKEAFRSRVLNRVRFDASGALRTEADAIVELRRLTRNLNTSDRGNLTEAWYGLARPGLTAHPDLLPADNTELPEVRRPDFLDGDELVELKSTRQGLNADHDVPQIENMLDATLTGGTVRVGGEARPVTRLRLVFTDIAGARGSVADLETWLTKYPQLTIEVFGTQGTRTTITRANLQQLMGQHGVATLDALLAAL